MSIFDLVGSVAWGLSTLPIPKINEFGRESQIYGAMGNAATCTAQGFAVQLNFTAIFYNISLSTYYLLGKHIPSFLNSFCQCVPVELSLTFKHSHCLWLA